ncbi:hypothetical protein NliqN6_4657 [Naganishia liquefaciens]|uniref:Serine/threonine-protein kinase TOR n=1 Tax=Naganishia liquefaciens TaxID=104408 RepID=A0A8H3YFZ5_9TREE|nr:hypothetical protein NliqN6_4657 [Naganishia liquefaciens]
MSSPSDVLDGLFRSLRSRHPEVREQAAVELRDYVAAYTEDHPQDDPIKTLWNDLNQRIFELIHSNQSHEKRGAIVAIDRLLDSKNDVAPEKLLQKMYRFYHYLKPVLPCADAEVMVQASKVVGRIAKIGGVTLGERFFEFEVMNALELMKGDRQEIGRYASVLILYQLSANAPILFMSYVVNVLDMIWTPLRDHRTVVRERTSMLLGSCLDLIHPREKLFRNEQYSKILDEAERTLDQRGASPDSIHGGLLALQSLLNHSEMFMKDHYRNACELILRFKDHKEPLIRRTVITLIPAMGTYDQQAFQELFLHRSMAHLQHQLSKPGERDAAFLAIGHLAVNLGSEMKPFIERIITNVKESLGLRGKKNAPDEKPIFQCIAMLASALGPSMTKYMHDVLDLMFQWGLTEQLRQALVVIARHIPPLLESIQERLLNLLSMILGGKPYKPLGAPPRYHAAPVSQSVLQAVSVSGHSAQTIALALYTLSSFDFTGHVLNEFVQTTALPYLENDSPDVRQTAALTCSKLFVRDPICHQSSAHSIEIISDVLDKLLTVAVADPEPRIRLAVLQSLDEKFDRHLAQAENVRSLFIAMNDEVFRNREVAITIIGRLAALNPAYVMPSLRKSLIQLITELEYTTARKQKEESARLLCLLIGASTSLIKPYAPPMLSVLLKTASAKDSSPAVTSYCLACLGELARVGGEEIAPSVDRIMALIMEMLADQTSTLTRDAALKTLGQVASNTGMVIEPYQKYPQLLGLLIRFLKTEKNQTIRRETIRTMGILGALDPYKHRILHDTTADPDADQSGAKVTDVMLLMNSGGTSPDEFYQRVAINALVQVLHDPTNTTHHWAAVEALMLIFKTQGLKCVSYLPQIMPALLSVVRLSPPSLQETYFHQLAVLVGIVKAHIRNYLDLLFDLVHDFWNPDSTLQLTITSLVEAIAIAVEGEFKAFLPRLLQEILRTFDGDFSASKISDKRRANLLRLVKAFYVFGTSVEEYMHLVLPVIVKCFERADAPYDLRSTALQTIGLLCRKVNFSDNASQIIHPLIRTLAAGDSELQAIAMQTLCALVLQFGADYAIFIPMVNKVLLTNRITHPTYEAYITKLLNREPLTDDLAGHDSYLDASAIATVAPEQHRLMVNQQHLKQVWNTDGITSPADWRNWLKRLGLEFMRESPSQALRSCAALAEVHVTFGQDLFNVAFVSCWTELYESYQDDLVKAIETAIASPNVPSEVVVSLLTLAEFMEHDERPLPIDPKMLGDYAMVYHAYAKALHYKEIEFFADTNNPIIEDLISVNTKLQQTDAAWGTLTFASETLDNFDLDNHETWYEKLNRWDQALEAYNRREEEDPEDSDIVLGKLRCLHALGHWENLSDYVQGRWTNASYEERRKMAPVAAAAAWSLSQWDLMDDYISVMKTDTPDRPFYRAILSVHRNQYSKALTQIARARDLLDGELTSLSNESYGRAYDVVVRVQMLSELEEIISYKKFQDQPARQETLRKTWMKRLKGCQPDVEVWQRILQVRTLVLNPMEATDMWIKFANLCRKSDRLDLACKTLNSLLGTSPPSGGETQGQTRAPPHVVYAYFKYTWAKGDRADSLDWLRAFTSRLSADVGLTTVNGQARMISADPALLNYTKLLARCHVKLGQWQVALQDNWVANNPGEILGNYQFATQLDPEWYKGWHTWALANFEVITHLETSQDILARNAFSRYIVPAVTAFFRSIALSRGDFLQDTLRLLTLWFTYGYDTHVHAAVRDGFATVNIDVWLEVIPQIIARLHTPRLNIRDLIKHLLSDVGKAHPQALIYPLTVASKSQQTARKETAEDIMIRMKDHSRLIVEQASLVSTELIRSAILWHEQWHEGLEEASKYYFGEHNPEGMFAVLEPLHDMVQKGPETLRETAFAQTFGHDLQAAREHCRRYRQTNEVAELNQAWDIYYSVFKRLSKQLTSLTSIELQYVSPRLLRARDLELAIPGTYQSGKPIVRISYVLPTFAIIGSKQRPRRFSMKGSDGKEYQYCLKGHEDLRQDERVMQLFGLVNTLLSTNPESFKRHLNIQRYSVIPLSPNSGLLGWVPHSDTLHVLIRDYRENRKILLNIEHRLMLQMAPDYDSLPLMHKVEVFEHALDNTTGQDLYRVLWLKSRNSEAWLERRTTYTRSLATSSMVGYILGLGDRHPSNIMLDQITGKIVHIDFGDCFEVAMHRDKFPERIPFRLTRMLTNAMEVSGIHGSYKRSCEIAMEVLRDNKDSLMAVLEAFVYDPLIAWRLVPTNNPGGAKEVEAEANGEGRAAYAPQRKNKADENEILNDAERPEVKNSRALFVIDRVKNKLTGRDFKQNVVLPVQDQVELLIIQATSLENLCQCFIGWCAFW